MNKLKIALYLTLGILAIPQFSYAGCTNECSDNYESAIENCNLLYPDPDDADDLSICIGNAKDEFDECVEDCRN